MKKSLLFSLLLITPLLKAQNLHHEMISSQGGSVVTSNGHIVSYSIGQQSISGTSTNGYVVQQGFQQNNWGAIIKQTEISISTKVYPNPFISEVQFEFSESPGMSLNVYVFDVRGRLVYSDNKKNDSNTISLNLEQLASAEYLVKLTSEKHTLYTKILKQD